ncbi:uncharacterized protein [Rutidosis leptorrhynchoides]|uniref:uncharacterized protein n=1 Tax=Rutidosis leptorrhynchoides TaxID=125765 RepID=UPI003A9961A4
MATKSGNMKGFYRQKKVTGGISKSKAKPNHAAAALGSGAAQPPALISHGSPDLKDDYNGSEDQLRQFDMNMAYGPCLGMTRNERWERANRLGLNPPKEIESLLKTGKVGAECLWDGRI